MLKAYLAIKYHADLSNRCRIETLTAALRSVGVEVFCVARDLEDWGARCFAPRDLMHASLQALLACDLVLVDLSEKGVGIGIEAGYAHAHRKPLAVTVPHIEDLSTTLAGIADVVLIAGDPQELAEQLRPFLARLTGPIAT